MKTFLLIYFSKEELIRINSLCRKENIMFFGGGLFGFFGFSFMDLVQHEYVEEEKEKKKEAGDGEPAAKKSKIEEELTKTVKKAMTFISLAETLKVMNRVQENLTLSASTVYNNNYFGVC